MTDILTDPLDWLKGLLSTSSTWQAWTGAADAAAALGFIDLYWGRVSMAVDGAPTTPTEVVAEVQPLDGVEFDVEFGDSGSGLTVTEATIPLGIVAPVPAAYREARETTGYRYTVASGSDLSARRSAAANFMTQLQAVLGELVEASQSQDEPVEFQIAGGRIVYAAEATRAERDVGALFYVAWLELELEAYQ